MSEWLSNRVTYIKALKRPTEQQELLVLLFENANRSPEEQKHLQILTRAERASERAETARVAAESMLNSRKDEERKARNHRLILQGTLIDLAGLQDRSRGELLGLLLAASRTTDPSHWASWKQAGDTLLSKKER